MAEVRVQDIDRIELTITPKALGFSFAPSYYLRPARVADGAGDTAAFFHNLSIPHTVDEGAFSSRSLRLGLVRARRRARGYRAAQGIRVLVPTSDLLRCSRRVFRRLAPHMVPAALCATDVFERHTRAWLRQQGVDPEVFLALGPSYCGRAEELCAASALIRASG